MDWTTYRQIDAVNYSTLKYMRRSPKHYEWRLSHPPDDTDAMKLGRAAHCAVFEPDRFPLDFTVWTEGVRRGKTWDAFREANVGRTILRLDEYAACLSMRDAVKEHPVAGPLLGAGEPEHTITWTDEETGLPCKARLDFLTPSCLLDLKTTNDLEPARFFANAARLGHHVQLGFYAMGLRTLGIEVPVKILGVESGEPYDVGVFTVSEDVLWAGETEARELLAKVAAGRFSKRWPGRFPAETPFDLPAWAFPYGGDDNEAASVLSIAAEG